MDERTNQSAPNETAAYPEFEGMGHVELAKALRQLKDEKETAEEALSTINKKFDHVRLVRLPKRMEEQEIEQIKIDGVGRIDLRGDLHVSILAADRAVAYQWCKDNGHEGLVVETINAQTLKAAVKKMIEAGEELPASIKTTPFTVAVLTRG